MAEDFYSYPNSSLSQVHAAGPKERRGIAESVVSDWEQRELTL